MVSTRTPFPGTGVWVSTNLPYPPSPLPGTTKRKFEPLISLFRTNVSDYHRKLRLPPQSRATHPATLYCGSLGLPGTNSIRNQQYSSKYYYYGMDIWDPTRGLYWLWKPGTTNLQKSTRVKTKNQRRQNRTAKTNVVQSPVALRVLLVRPGLLRRASIAAKTARQYGK